MYKIDEILKKNSLVATRYEKNNNVYFVDTRDGKFVLKERSLELNFRGSKNQRIIDVKQSLEKGKIILFMD